MVETLRLCAVVCETRNRRDANTKRSGVIFLGREEVVKKSDANRCLDIDSGVLYLVTYAS
jgi:hypothetical protein